MSSQQSLEEKYANCPVIKTLEEVGSRWRMTVIHVLREGDLRFNELKRATDANSQTLSRVLDELEEKEYVERAERVSLVVGLLHPPGESFPGLANFFSPLITDTDRHGGKASQ